MSQKLSLDLETHSEVNLVNRGAYNYAMDPSTGVYCMAYAFDEQPPRLWIPAEEPFPASVEAHILDGGKINAFNSAFERLMFWYVICPDYDVPEPAIDQFHCTAARARAHGLPGSLDNCTRALGLPLKKHPEGRRLIMQYSARNIPWHEIDPADQKLWLDYVVSDVEAERMVGNCLRELSDAEWAEFYLNERTCNDRGVPVDLAFAEAALDYADEVREAVNDELVILTNGKIQKATERKSRDEWVLPRLTDDQVKLITVIKQDDDGNDVKKTTFDQPHRDALIVDPDLDLDVVRYLELLDEAGGATISKYRAILQRSVDDTVKGTMLFNGAGQTGRFSSTAPQFHNMSRQKLSNVDDVIDTVVEGIYEIDNPADSLKRAIRSVVYHPEGLSWYDFSSIEGRVAPWLQGGDAGQAKLDLYINGVDPYKYNASRTFDVPIEHVTDDQRQAGKIQELSLGFLGGVGALRLMARNFKMHISEDQAAVMRDAWRAANPWAQLYGSRLETAVMAAMRHVGHWKEAGRVAYAYDGKDWLWCRLPSGRVLAYFDPRITEVITPWGEPRMAVETLWGGSKPKVGEPWPRRALHGGIMLENVTQAVAADLLREALVRVDQAGLTTALHVHDEIICEGYCEQQLGEIMLEPPTWAEGLPLAGSGGSGIRYGK